MKEGLLVYFLKGKSTTLREHYFITSEFYLAFILLEISFLNYNFHHFPLREIYEQEVKWLTTQEDIRGNKAQE